MSRSTIDFGIDLGTTNSTIAVIEDLDARVIPNKLGSTATPSAVWVDKRGSVHVGQEAKLRALQSDPENADLEFKLRMGLGEEGGKTFRNGGISMTPEALSAEILKSMKLDVQSSMDEEVRAAVITVPAAFENPQTAATRRAAELAGFVRGPLVLEPVAASLAYGFQTRSENVYWLVYDFGGGTFDAAVMRIREGQIQVVGHDGDNYLGGKLIDWDIVTRCFCPALAGGNRLSDFRRSNPRWRAAFGKLKYYAEQGKIEVCRSRAPHDVWIEGLCEDNDGRSVDFAYTLQPEEVESVCMPYLEKSLELCRSTLSREGLAGTDMERVLLVGGTTLNPWVREGVARELGCPTDFSIDPITVVAKGAAIFAGTRLLPDEAKKPVERGEWVIRIEHKPVGNVQDPDIGGSVAGPDGQSAENHCIEFVDRRTKWRSGRIRLDARGVFMTQLHAEESRRCEYEIELTDPTGVRLRTNPGVVVYTIGVTPEEHPPAAMTIGVGLANGEMKPYIRKGAKLPCEKSMDHYTTVDLQAGEEGDELRIPLLEGEHPRAVRNHGIGTLTIRGSDIRRNLPSGSQVDIAVAMDESQQVRVRAYVPALDEDFEVRFNSIMQHDSPEELRRRLAEQKARVDAARSTVNGEAGGALGVALSQIDGRQMIRHLDNLMEAAAEDADAVVQLDRKLRELAAAADELEDLLEWPAICAKAEESRSDTQRVIEGFGDRDDRSRLKPLESGLTRAIEAGDVEMVRKFTEDLDGLWYQVLSRQPEYHIARFDWLAERRDLMRSPGQADQIIARGVRARDSGNTDLLKSINAQLIGLLPQEARCGVNDPRVGGTMTMC